MKRSLSILAIVFAVLFSAAVQLEGQGVGKIVRVDPAVNAILPANAHIEKLADDFGFLEGPVWVHSSNPGYLLFSDIPANVIDKWSPDGKVSVFLEKSGFTGTNPEGVGYPINNGRRIVIL
ncbi:MAG: SMP-30/gluconolactonase/LRE family protein, partial [Terriglobia bacterium]